MFKNYMKITLRNLYKYKIYSFINITGLAIGMAICIVIFLYVKDELSYDRFHENSEQIHRLIRNNSAPTSAPVGPAMADEFPEVFRAVRFDPFSKLLVSFGKEKRFYEKKASFVDGSVFDVFSFKLFKGDPKTALQEPNSMVLTQEIAKKYFGDEKPIGKTLNIEWGNASLDLKVTGLLEKIPHNSHLDFNILISFKTMEGRSSRLENWKANWLYTYLLLSKKTSHQNLEAKLPGLFEKHTGDTWKNHRIQPLKNVYLHSNVRWEMGKTGSIAYVYIFSLIGVLVLLIACINFMNLTTARSIHRSKEIGMRKVLGAFRFQLIKQFIGESLVFSFMGLTVAIVLVELCLPFLNEFTGKRIVFQFYSDWLIFGGLILTSVFVGFFSGSYPAFFLSGFKITEVLKGKLKSGSMRALFRKGLVIFQFTISIALIIGTIIIFNQLHYLKNKNLGLEKEQKIVISFEEDSFSKMYTSIKNELLQNPDILNVSVSGNVPGEGVSDFFYLPEGAPEENLYNTAWNTYFIDHDFMQTLNINVIQGRNFSKDQTTDINNFIINESMIQYLVSQYGEIWGTPVGRKVDFYLPGRDGWKVYKSGTIIGVVKDFHYRSLHQPIEPLILQMFPQTYENLLVNIQTENITETVSFLRNTINEFVPDSPFEYFFLDDHFDKFYRGEEKLGNLFSVFALIAICIACLGLFGLAAFTAEQHIKEIGIRKVLGASVSNIVLLLSKDFIRLVVIANIVAWPIAYYAINSWLQNFAYRIDIGVFVFLLAGFLALVIAILTVSYQAIKAALANPVETLRYE